LPRRAEAMFRLRVGVLISGRGSNLRALLAACADTTYPAEIAAVVSDRAEAPGLAFAQSAGICSAFIPHHAQQAFAAQAEVFFRHQGIQLVCLAGFMRVLDAGFVEAWRDRMINIHPSLLPAFPGLHPQSQALAAGVRFTGCTVHYVRPEVDAGPIIAQAVVATRADDDETSLSARILSAEHRLYPLVVRLIAEERVQVVAGKVEIEGWQAPRRAMLNPREPPRKSPVRGWS